VQETAPSPSEKQSSEPKTVQKKKRGRPVNQTPLDGERAREKRRAFFSGGT
jgi:hypothetical protein